MTRDELKERIQSAYDAYLDKLDAIAKAAGTYPSSPREIQHDPDTRVAAALAWVKFKHEQDEFNDEFNAPRDAAALAREKAKQMGSLIATRLSQARDNLVQASLNLKNEHKRIDAMRRAGIPVTPDEAAGIIAKAQAQIDHWQSEIDRLKTEMPSD